MEDNTRAGKPSPAISRKCWVFSLDALGASDAEIFLAMPGFSRILQNGFSCLRMRSVAPTLTYPAHASIVSGRPPASTGIANNLRLQPQREKADWNWYGRYIQGDTLFRAAHRQGRTTAALLWPVTAREAIDWNLPEIMPNRAWQNQIMMSLYASTFPLALHLERRFGKLRKGIHEPELDNFTEAAAYDLLENQDPDLLFVHWVDVDTQKHRYGAEAPEVTAAIGRLSARLERLLAYRATRPDADRIDIVILSDHSQWTVHTPLYLHDALFQECWLQRSENVVCSWRAIDSAAGGCAYVYAKPEVLKNEEERGVLRKTLDRFSRRTGGVERILTGREAGEMGADPTCAFLLEAKRGYYFSPFFPDTKRAVEEAKNYRGEHGYLPDHPGYEAIFCGNGPGFPHGTRESGSLLDIAPTLSAVLGLDLQGASGKSMV